MIRSIKTFLAGLSTLGLLALAASWANGQTSSDTLVVGWSDVRPIFFEGEDGEAAGFGIEVIRQVAASAGLTLEFRKFDTPEAMIRAQAEGETDLLPGIAALPVLTANNAFSDPIAETSIRVFIRSEDTERLDPDTMTGVRIAVPSVPLGAEGDALKARNVPVEVPVGTLSIMELLRGKIDALVASDSVTISDAYTMRLDHRIVAAGAPLRRFDRVVAVNRSRQDLLPAINRVIADLEADGTLQRLRETWLIAVPPPEPDVLTVGVYHLPPFNIIEGDGDFSGFSVETLRNLAEAAGLEIQMIEISREEWGQGPGAGRYDIITQAGINAERRERMDFTLPTNRVSLELFVRAGEGDGVTDLDALRGRRVGVEAVNAGWDVAERHRGLDVQVFAGEAALLQGLLDGQVDAVIFPRAAFLREAKRTGTLALIEEIQPPVHIVERAVALRFGLGQVRERLNAVIPAYLASEDNDVLRETYFGVPPFWTDRRVSWLLGGAGALTLLLLGLTGYVLWQRRRAETERYRFAAELLDHVPLGIMMISPNGRIDYANDEIREQTPGGPDVLTVGADYRDAIATLIQQQAIETGARSPSEMVRQIAEVGLQDGHREEFALADGSIVLRTAKRLSNDATLLAREDVSEDRRIRSALQAERTRLAAVMDAAHSGILGLSVDGKVVIANVRSRHLLGGVDLPLPFDWPSNIRFLDAEDLSPLDASSSPINRALAGQTLTAEISLLSRTAAQEPRYVRISSVSVDPDTASGVQVVVVIDDVSEEERNRQKVERASRLDALGQLTGGIAHDFNNLLATIDYAVQLAATETDPAARSRYTRTAMSSVRRGAELTNRLLAFAKRQPGLAASQKVSLVLGEFKQLAQPTIEETIDLTFMQDDKDLWVFCDIAQLENALLNLVLNARDAIIRSGQGNRIEVQVRSVAEVEADQVLRREHPDTYIAQGLHAEHSEGRRRDDDRAYRYVEFSVTDNGPGMDDETKRRAIDPFFTTKDSNSGTGLGLSMVYGFIQQANGELRIYSEIGHGTTVRMLLPRGAASGERELPVERLPSPSGSGQTILLVEDEAGLIAMMEEIIAALGYRVETARDAKQAIEILEAGKTVDLLLTDVVMPGGIGGFQLAKRARDLRPKLPVIYMSGYAGFSVEEMGDVTASLIQKPVQPSDLAEAIRATFKDA